MTLAVGLGFAAASALLNGTWGLLAKASPRSTPLIFNHWVAEGVSISGLLLAIAPPRVFTAWGVLSGMLFVLSAGHAVAAIRLIGLALASGIWCGVAVLASFAFAVLVAGDSIQHPGKAAAGLALLLIGIVGIATAGWLGGQGSSTRSSDEKGGFEHEAALLEGEEEAELTGTSGSTCPLPQECKGLAAAVVAGLLGGLILAPMSAAPEEARGLQYVPSMAVGTLLSAPLLTFLLSYVSGSGVSLSALADEQTAWVGMAAGVLWNCGNVCSILATQDPHVGLAVAYPIMQCGLFVAGAWGILLFGEMRGRAPQAMYWASGLVLIVGAALLAAAK